MAQVLIELNQGGAVRRKFVHEDDVALWAEAGWAVPPGVSTGGQASGYDAVVTDAILRPGSLTRNAIDARVTAVGDATYAPADTIDARRYGTIDATGAADSSTAFLLALTAAQNLGATLMLPPGKIRVNSQIILAQTAGKQKSLRITGAGRQTNWGTNGGTGGTVLDLRYSGSGAKITTYGQGLLELDHMTLTDGGTSSNPFVQTIGTLLHAHDLAVVGNPSKSRETCDQDGFILGGLPGTTANDSIDNAFQGYGTVIERVVFEKIQRGVLVQNFGNSIIIRDNSFSNRCGSVGDAGAIEINPGTAPAIPGGEPAAFASGTIISGNLIEVYGYKYGIRLLNKSQQNLIMGNSFWDVHRGDYVCDIYFDATANTNSVVSSGVQTQNKHIVDANGTNMYSGALFGDTGYVQTLRANNQGLRVTGGGGIIVDNNAGAIRQNDSGGTARTLLTLSSSNVIYLGDALGAMSSNSVIVRCGATGSIIRLRGGSTDQVQVSSTGLGFFGTAPVAKPSLTYSRATENAAQTQIRTALVTLGLVADNTTA